MREIPVPTIAAINGAAIGAGLCFAMACDIRVVSEKAKLGFTFVKLGLHPGTDNDQIDRLRPFIFIRSTHLLTHSNSSTHPLQLVYPPTNLPGMGATHFIATVAGYETANRLLLTGDIITGREAKDLRLATQTAPDGQSCVEAAKALATRIASQAPLAVRATVLSLRAKQDRDLDQALLRCEH